MSNKRAFFLFEVTLTVAILSIGLVFVIRSINTSMRVARAASNYNQAIHLAYEKGFELELISSLQNVSLDLVEREGTFTNNNNFGWKYLIDRLEDYNLSRVDLEIFWKDGKREGSLDITTYVQ